jgi:hypothetical protein
LDYGTATSAAQTAARQLHADYQPRRNTEAIVAPPGAVAQREPRRVATDTRETITVSLAKEVGTTIRIAITEWPQTLRLISLLAAATGPAALIVLLVVLLRL